MSLSVATSTRDFLKEATLDLHQEVEESLSLTQTPFSLADYRRLLEKFYGFYCPLEEKLSALSQMPLDLEWPRRLKTPWLETDLRALGGPLPSSVCSKFPAFDSMASLLGVLYVLEGSTLGGQFLKKHFQNTLGLSANQGLRFFAGHESQTGEMWRAFLNVLEREVLSEKDRETALIAARETFLLLGQWMTGA